MTLLMWPWARAVLALLSLALVATRCAGLAPIPPAAVTPPVTAGETPAAAPTVVPPTADPALMRLMSEFAAQRRVSLPWAGSGATELTAAPAVPATDVPAVEAVAGCAGITVRSGPYLTIDGQPFAFFGVNAHYLLDGEFDEAKVEPLLAEMSERGINTIRVFFFPYHDADRFERLLDAGSRHGIRFVVTLEDNVFQGIDWFSDEDIQDDYVEHLDDTVQRFKDRPEVLIWELVNEPNCGEGRHDDDCLETIRGWVGKMAERVAAIDPCRPISNGMIGDGNYENEQKSFRMANRKGGIGIVSVHRRDTDRTGGELEFAEDEEMPIFYGEIYDVAYDDGCSPLSGDRSPTARADRVKDDLREAIDDGVDGYLLWDYAASGYCSEFGFESDDPLWDKLRRTEDVPGPVPWR